MDKSEIFESAIRELTEEAVSQRKEQMDESEQGSFLHIGDEFCQERWYNYIN